MKTTLLSFVLILAPALGLAQNAPPFVPQPVLQGGQIVPLFPPCSPFLDNARIGEAEQNNMMRGVRSIPSF
jgi:endo-1,4-beta-xylanase